MKKFKFAFAIVALSVSASASAMPAAVPGRWYDQMMSRLTTMANNPGFCTAHAAAWICDAL